MMRTHNSLYENTPKRGKWRSEKALLLVYLSVGIVWFLAILVGFSMGCLVMGDSGGFGTA
jgi:hypothetical protein